MATEFHTLRVSNIEKNTADTVLVTFDIPIELQSQFAFTQGQYLTLKTDINGEEVRRSYSLCTAPSDKAWKVAIKKIDGGKFSSYANDTLKVGDNIEVMLPDGNFFVNTDPQSSKNYIAFAAGSGITPVASIIKAHLGTEENSTFKLFYTNRNVKSIILKEEIEALKNVYLDRFEIFHFLTRESRNSDLFDGRINQDKLERIFDQLANIEDIDHYFLCGPNEMIFLIKEWLEAKGVSSDKIHFELFNTDGLSPAKTESSSEEKPTLESSEVTVTEGGKTFTFPFGGDSGNILDEAMRQGADLPYACKGGVCCTCKAKLIEGQVEMEVNYALEDDEVEEGYILCCQSVPTTATVKIDFDY